MLLSHPSTCVLGVATRLESLKVAVGRVERETHLQKSGTGTPRIRKKGTSGLSTKNLDSLPTRSSKLKLSITAPGV